MYSAITIKFSKKKGSFEFDSNNKVLPAAQEILENFLNSLNNIEKSFFLRFELNYLLYILPLIGVVFFGILSAVLPYFALGSFICLVSLFVILVQGKKAWFFFHKEVKSVVKIYWE